MTITRIRVTMMLCDYAQVADGKLFVSGGGWNITGTPTGQSAIAILLSVPWTHANKKIEFRVHLLDGDGDSVTQQAVTGEATPVELSGAFEVGRPAGLPEGSALETPLAINVPPLLLRQGRYVWELSIDGKTDPDWQLSFLVRGGSVLGV